MTVLHYTVLHCTVVYFTVSCDIRSNVTKTERPQIVLYLLMLGGMNAVLTFRTRYSDTMTVDRALLQIQVEFGCLRPGLPPYPVHPMATGETSLLAHSSW